MFNKTYLIYFSILIISAFLGCGRGKPSVTLAGSTAFQPFAEKLADEYMKTHDIKVTVQGGGSAVGIQAASSGAANIGMADLIVLPEEAASLTSIAVAQDGIAVIVNPRNLVNDITTDQLRDVFNGKIVNWKEVGGNDAPITVVSREAGSGTRSSFEDILTDVNLKRDALIQDSNGTIRETVANDANSIGYISHGLTNDKVKALKIDGQQSSTESILAGNYKLVRPVYFLTKGEPQAEVRNFIDYVLSADGQGLIQANGLLPAKQVEKGN